MTLRGALTAQLAVQASLTCEAFLALAFPLSALARAPLADVVRSQTFCMPAGFWPGGRVLH